MGMTMTRGNIHEERSTMWEKLASWLVAFVCLIGGLGGIVRGLGVLGGIT